MYLVGVLYTFVKEMFFEKRILSVVILILEKKISSWCLCLAFGLQVLKEAVLSDLNSLIAETGGSLGLFLGASFVTFFDSFIQLFSRTVKSI